MPGNNKPQQIVSLSGGRDSTAMLLMMLEKGEQIDDIVFFDWGKEYPEMYAHLIKLENYIGRSFTRLYPKYTWEYYRDDYVRIKGAWKGIKGYGLPQAGRAWCTAIKRDIIKKHCGNNIQCIGFAFEERHRAKYKPWQRFPLLEWGVHTLEAYHYCLNLGFGWGGLYENYARVSCMCCPYVRELLPMPNTIKP